MTHNATMWLPMANRDAVYTALRDLGAVYPSIRNGMEEGRLLDVWTRVLDPCDDSALDQAVWQWLDNGDGSKYPPKPGEIRAMASEGRTSSDTSSLPDGCGPCGNTGRRFVTILRWEPLDSRRDQQRKALRTLTTACNCHLGRHYARDYSQFWDWNALADKAWQHHDTVMGDDDRPCVLVDASSSDIRAWMQPLRGRTMPPMGAPPVRHHIAASQFDAHAAQRAENIAMMDPEKAGR